MELAVTPRVVPGVAEFARGGLPAAAETDDGNTWPDSYCWLCCVRAGPAFCGSVL